MIHIATVHFQSDQWIQTQLAYLRKHIASPFRVYAWLNDVPAVPPGTFHYSCSEPVTAHAVKLNLLADLIYFDSNREDDILIFLDGDAFPVGDIGPFLREKLKTHKLIAIQRLENNGDFQPHPCFCATTVGFWRSIKGDWKEGYEWQTKTGKRETDVGGNLLKLLLDNKVDWYPLLRTQSLTPHPVFFGIYADLIYHHGAGFRSKDAVSRFDMINAKITIADKAFKIFPWRYKRVLRRRLRKRISGENNLVSEGIFKKIQDDPRYFEARVKSAGSESRNDAEHCAR
ncbi:MAG TPA: hypothetical protein VIV82_06590 [Verrucomicrobiae bacterium]|jgi:hypothetical protein